MEKHRVFGPPVKIIEGVQFKGGIEVMSDDQAAT